MIWAVALPDRLGARFRAALVAPENDLFVSAATAWEISIKHSAGRLGFPLYRFAAEMSDLGADIVPISAAHAIAAGQLPRLHGDPFDRMLIAQAQVEHCVLMSCDAVFAHYAVPLFGPRS